MLLLYLFLTIFLKAVTEAMLFNGKKNTHDEDEGNEIVQNVTDLQTDADSVDLEASATDKISLETFEVKELAMSPTQIIDSEDEKLESIDVRSHYKSSGKYSWPRRTLPWQKRPQVSSIVSLSLPSMNEDYEENLAQDSTSNFIANTTFVDTNCFNSDESDGNDDDEHLCAICLSRYSKSSNFFRSDMLQSRY
jgi:hypothetical protein